MSYLQTLQNWQGFYATAGTAAAALVGLLFVGLTLHIRVVVTHPDVRSLARVTLVNFFDVLLLALVMLTPATDPRATAAWLIAIAAISIALVIRPVIQALRSTRTLRLPVLASRFGLSGLCYLSVGATAIIFQTGNINDGLNDLLFTVIFLLIVAVRNTWDLLVVVAAAPPANPARENRS